MNKNLLIDRPVSSSIRRKISDRFYFYVYSLFIYGTVSKLVDIIEKLLLAFREF